MMGLDTPKTCRGWRNILRISCTSSWFFFTRSERYLAPVWNRTRNARRSGHGLPTILSRGDTSKRKRAHCLATHFTQREITLWIPSSNRHLARAQYSTYAQIRTKSWPINASSADAREICALCSLVIVIFSDVFRN